MDWDSIHVLSANKDSHEVASGYLGHIVTRVRWLDPSTSHVTLAHYMLVLLEGSPEFMELWGSWCVAWKVATVVLQPLRPYPAWFTSPGYALARSVSFFSLAA